MRPTKMQPGDIVVMQDIRNPLEFVFRIPAQGATPAKNIFKCEAWRGMNGTNDPGYGELSDSDVSRRCSRA